MDGELICFVSLSRGLANHGLGAHLAHCLFSWSFIGVHICILCMATSMMLQQSWVVAIQTVWPAKPKLFTIWPFSGKVCQSFFILCCQRKRNLNKNVASPNDSQLLEVRIVVIFVGGGGQWLAEASVILMICFFGHWSLEWTFHLWLYAFLSIKKTSENIAAFHWTLNLNSISCRHQRMPVFALCLWGNLCGWDQRVPVCLPPGPQWCQVPGRYVCQAQLPTGLLRWAGIAVIVDYSRVGAMLGEGTHSGGYEERETLRGLPQIG